MLNEEPFVFKWTFKFYISDETIPHLYLRYPSIRLFRLLLILRVRLTKKRHLFSWKILEDVSVVERMHFELINSSSLIHQQRSLFNENSGWTPKYQQSWIFKSLFRFPMSVKLSVSRTVTMLHCWLRAFGSSPYESSWLLWHTRFSMIKSTDVISKVTQRLNRCDRSWSNWWKDTLMIWMKMSYFETISRKWVPVEGLVNRPDDWSLSVLVCEGSLIYLTKLLCELESLTNFYLCSESMVQKRFESEGYLLVKNPFLKYT